MLTRTSNLPAQNANQLPPERICGWPGSNRSSGTAYVTTQRPDVQSAFIVKDTYPRRFFNITAHSIGVWT